jgi:colicin import membrane protein
MIREVDHRSLILTIAFHAILLIIFFIGAFTTPLPLPAEQGILINFGDVEMAKGNSEPKFNDTKTVQPRQEAAEQKVKEVKTTEKIVTQDYEEAAAVKEHKETRKKEPVKTNSEVKKPVVTENKTEKKTEEIKKPEPVVNSNALYRGRKSNTDYSGSEGVSSGTGNQGAVTGSENATDRSLYGGTGGTTFNLEGRNFVSLPKPDISTQKEGKVVVEIKVDRAGNVVNATPGVKGSTTLESSLLNAAKRAALSSKFDSKTDAAYMQTGTITYIFKF